MTPLSLCPPGFECDTSRIQLSDTAVWDVSLLRRRSDVLIKWCTVCLALWDLGSCVLGVGWVVKGGPPIVGCGWVVWRILILGHGTLWTRFILNTQCQEHARLFASLSANWRVYFSWRDGRTCVSCTDNLTGQCFNFRSLRPTQAAYLLCITVTINSCRFCKQL